MPPPAALEQKRFGHFNEAITRNRVDLGNVVSAEFTHANNLDRIEAIRSDRRIDGADPSIAAGTGRIEVRFADQTLVTEAIIGDAFEIAFAYVLPLGVGFTFIVQAVHSWTCAIARLVTGRVRIALGGVGQPSGWLLDTTTGVVTLAGGRCLPHSARRHGDAP